MDNSEGEKCRIIADKRQHQRNDREDEAGQAENAAQAEGRGQPGDRRRDENLRGGGRGAEPRAFVERKRKPRLSRSGSPMEKIRLSIFAIEALSRTAITANSG